jgi:hypothetical protein
MLVALDKHVLAILGTPFQLATRISDGEHIKIDKSPPHSQTAANFYRILPVKNVLYGLG